jgi:hypothetical protein
MIPWWLRVVYVVLVLALLIWLWVSQFGDD